MTHEAIKAYSDWGSCVENGFKWCPKTMPQNQPKWQLKATGALNMFGTDFQIFPIERDVVSLKVFII